MNYHYNRGHIGVGLYDEMEPVTHDRMISPIIYLAQCLHINYMCDKADNAFISKQVDFFFFFFTCNVYSSNARKQF